MTTPSDKENPNTASSEVSDALLVRVKEVDQLPENLISLAPTPNAFSCWLGDRVELVGWGCALRLQFDGVHAIREAARTWDRIAAAARIEVHPRSEVVQDELKWPVAVASFGFASHTPGVLLVPASAAIRVHGERGSRCWLVTAALGNSAPEPDSVLTAAITPMETPSGLWTDPGRMTQSKWKEAVGRLVMMLRSGAASKVVLTRDIVVSASNPLDERYLADQLQHRYPTTWVYAVEGLIGATPEMLASLDRELFESRVLAGTSAPGNGAELLDSIKNRTEHHLAVESVARAVAPLTESMNVPVEPELLELPNVTHLSTEVTAIIRDANVLDVVDALHPTAAVCGTPTKLAFDILEGIEGTQRGRYTGPVGWVDGNGDGEFGIALRCGQLSEDRESIRVFAGGGIMPDSNPDLELAETRAKMRPLLEALQVENP
ncbi:chorismate-binding protein [Actinomycetaceae bacterium MB13-C1-2]|nr:chorismate-binding protein [Actinomycetaceae bacterium MB13-C1-2]